MKIFKIAICILLTCLILCACTNKRLTPNGEKLIDNKTGIEYNVAPSCYEPIGLGTEYARSDRQGYDVTYYRIGELSPLEWLTDGEYNVYYANGVTLPSFDEMSFNRIVVCEEYDALISVKDITDASLVNKVIDGYKNAQETEYLGLKADAVYKLKFRSAIYPYIQYSLTYYEYTDGCKVQVNVDDITTYEYYTNDESVTITTAENSDGGWTVTYDYGKYFIRNEYTGDFFKVSDELADIVGNISYE